MSPLTPAIIKEVKSRITSIMCTPVSSIPAMAKIDKELNPILKELVPLGFLGYGSRKQHPTSKQLFNWLMHPHRTAEEFIYVLSPLVHTVYNICNGSLIYMGMAALEAKGYMLFVGAAALEALAIKCPVLEGTWENSVWLIMQIIYHIPGGPITPSDRLSTWIINMIGDADVCPNAYLRIQLMYLLKMNIVMIGAHNRTQALEAVMAACSNLNSNCLDRDDYKGNFHNCSYINFKTIVEIVRLIKNGLPEFGETLAKKLNEVSSSRLISMVYDATYSCSLNPNSYTEPRELASLVALLNTTSEYAKDEFDHIEHQMCAYDHMERHMYTYYLMKMFEMLIKNFKSCYQTPQLTYPTAVFVINVMEYIIRNELYPYSPAFNNERGEFIPEMDDSNIIKMDHLLHELLTGNSSVTLDNSPIVREVIFRYGSRLKSLKEHFENLDVYPVVYSLMNHI